MVPGSNGSAAAAATGAEPHRPLHPLLRRRRRAERLRPRPLQRYRRRLRPHQRRVLPRHRRLVPARGAAPRRARAGPAPPGRGGRHRARRRARRCACSATRPPSPASTSAKGMLAEARRRRLGIRLVQARAEALPVADRSVDFVSMGYALRHVADLGAAFARIPARAAPRRPGAAAGDRAAGGAGRARRAQGLSRPRGALRCAAGPRRAAAPASSWTTTGTRSRPACRPTTILRHLRAAGFADVRCDTALGVFKAYSGRRAARRQRRGLTPGARHAPSPTLPRPAGRLGRRRPRRTRRARRRRVRPLRRGVALRAGLRAAASCATIRRRSPCCASPRDDPSARWWTSAAAAASSASRCWPPAWPSASPASTATGRSLPRRGGRRRVCRPASPKPTSRRAGALPACDTLLMVDLLYQLPEPAQRPLLAPPPAPRAAAWSSAPSTPIAAGAAPPASRWRCSGRAVRGDRNAIRPLPLAAFAAPFEAAGFAVVRFALLGEHALAERPAGGGARGADEGRRRAASGAALCLPLLLPAPPAAAQPTERRPLAGGRRVRRRRLDSRLSRGRAEPLPRPRAALPALPRRDPAERRPRRARPVLPRRRPRIQPQLQRRPRRPLARQPRAGGDAGPRLPRRGRPRAPLGALARRREAARSPWNCRCAPCSRPTSRRSTTAASSWRRKRPSSTSACSIPRRAPASASARFSAPGATWTTSTGWRTEYARPGRPGFDAAGGYLGARLQFSHRRPLTDRISRGRRRARRELQRRDQRRQPALPARVERHAWSAACPSRSTAPAATVDSASEPFD